ncbi:MAG: HAD family phosphatase [Chloroflexales bacterium]
MAIRALILDVGGVLLQLAPAERERRWEQRLGLAPGAMARALVGTNLTARATRGQVSAEAIWALLGQRLALTADQLHQIQHRYLHEEGLDPAMVALLRQLRPRYRLALLTNAWSDARAVLSARFGLDQLVDTIVISAEVGMAKPDPAMYRLTLDCLDVAPQETLFVDNKARNTLAAAALGIPSIVFQHSAQAIAAIQDHLEAG